MCITFYYVNTKVLKWKKNLNDYENVRQVFCQVFKIKLVHDV